MLTDFSPLLSRLQTVIVLPVLHTYRAQALWVICFPAGTKLLASAFCFSRRDVIAEEQMQTKHRGRDMER